jgi:hypothetical protein
VPPLVLAWLLLLAGSLACKRDQPQRFAPRPGPRAHAEQIHRPAKLTSIEATHVAGLGAESARVACATCHALRPSKPLPTSTADLKEFHVGLTFAHGALACASCHVEGRTDALHLADGTLVPMTEALRLCGQCHGPQLRDYQHGAHGGMTGYWDRSAGPRLRNHCVDCHDPHAPRYPGMRPAPAPRDRGLDKSPAQPGGHRS